MPGLVLKSSRHTFDLDSVFKTGAGVQVLRGVNGLGLPPVAVRFREGAGDGALYRGRRVLQRDLDLPLLIQGRDREGLKLLLSQLSTALTEVCTLSFVEDDGTDWSTRVVRVGGGDYTYGVDTVGETDVRMTITVRAGDPYFTYSRETRKQIGGITEQRGMLPRLGSMKVTSSQAIGEIELENHGDVSAYPVWEVTGPGRIFTAKNDAGHGFRWNGVLAANERLIVDTKYGTVRKGDGSNAYGLLASVPRFFPIPVGLSSAEASFLDTTSQSKIVCAFRPRKELVI